jgi:hypothetical protein
MIAPSQSIVHDPDVLPALRELFSQHPEVIQSGPETVSWALYMLRFLSYRPETFKVEAALEAFKVEGEVLP